MLSGEGRRGRWGWIGEIRQFKTCFKNVCIVKFDCVNSIRTYIHSMKRLQERPTRNQGGESTGKVLDLGRIQYSCLKCIEVVIGENKRSA